MKHSRWLGFLLIDLALVLIFAVSGRQQHEHGLSVLGILQTAAPFMAALVIATLITVPVETHSRLWPQGVLVWILTVGMGMALRVWTGATAEVPFIVVATLVLGLFLMGRRLITGRILRRSMRHTSA
ncbi:hypothetical protein GCM10023166_21940 [Paeniglutamicibacter cryotolerans]